MMGKKLKTYGPMMRALAAVERQRRAGLAPRVVSAQYRVKVVPVRGRVHFEWRPVK